MKQSVKELANETTTSSSGISDVQGTEWLKAILETAKKKMYFEQFAYVANVPKGNKDVVIPVASSNKSFTNSKSEGQARTMTEIDNVSSVTLEPSSANLGASIAKEVVQTSQVDVVKFAREQMAYDAALKIDTAFATALAAAASPAAELYGGDAAAVGDLADGDIITTDLVAEAQRYLKANGWVSEQDRPFVLFVPAVAEEAFLKDSQFVNAAEYGDNEVVANGEIGRYLGIRVVVTEQCPSKGTGDGWGTDGHICFLAKAKVAYGIAYREKPTLDFEYKKDEAAYEIYLDMAYACDTLQEGALVLINVTDA